MYRSRLGKRSWAYIPPTNAHEGESTFRSNVTNLTSPQYNMHPFALTLQIMRSLACMSPSYYDTHSSAYRTDKN